MTGGRGPKQAIWDIGQDGGAWIIIIPLLPPSLNKWIRMHWAAKGGFTRELTNNLRMVAMAYQIPQFGKCTVQIRYYFPTARRRDADNYAGKALLDSLRYAGILTDDDHKTITLPEPVIEVDRLRPRTEVWITPLKGVGIECSVARAR